MQDSAYCQWDIYGIMLLRRNCNAKSVSLPGFHMSFSHLQRQANVLPPPYLNTDLKHQKQPLLLELYSFSSCYGTIFPVEKKMG